MYALNTYTLIWVRAGPQTFNFSLLYVQRKPSSGGPGLRTHLTMFRDDAMLQYSHIMYICIIFMYTVYILHMYIESKNIQTQTRSVHFLSSC